MRGVSKGHFDHGVAGQCAVKIVELLSAGGPDGERDAEVVARFAGTHLDVGRIEAWVELLCQRNHGFGKAVNACAHDFDGKVTGVFNQRFFAWIA